MTETNDLWNRFQARYTNHPSIGLGLDLSRMNFPDDYFEKMTPTIQKAFVAMAELEKGGIANLDEQRMVGHYWLRKPELAPTPTLAKEITDVVKEIKIFAEKIHRGEIQGAKGPFRNVLAIGIGGSALGPQFVADALGNPVTDKLKLFFFDNTDPDGMDKILATLGDELGQTLCLVISKSGGTKETRNGMLEATAAYEKADLKFGPHAVAVTGAESALSLHARANHWLAEFPMWDWVGGRTSQTSAVGLLPAALQGLDIDQLLAGAGACDEITRLTDVAQNPAAQMALMWHYIGNGKGSKDLVILPYKDRLALLSRYLQQLIMESLGKERDVNDNVVNQGLAVYGNKGSTDQHAYVQQLREGLNNFFVTFVEVLRDRESPSMTVEQNVTSGDYLSGFFLGTRAALYEKGRESITITINEVSPLSVGVLIALFERTVGLYASLININAYHQPGVEAGKKAAGEVISAQLKILDHLMAHQNQAFGCVEIAEAIGAGCETVFKVCEHLAANPDRGVQKSLGTPPAKTSYSYRA